MAQTEQIVWRDKAIRDLHEERAKLIAEIAELRAVADLLERVRSECDVTFEAGPETDGKWCVVITPRNPDLLSELAKTLTKTKDS